MSVTHSTFVIERTYPKPPARVFAAFSDKAKKQRWFAEGENHSPEQYELDFREGGRERSFSRFKEGSPFPGVTLTHEGAFLKIVPDQLIVDAYTMKLGDHTMSASLLTVELHPHEGGTRLVLTHQGAYFEPTDGPERREAGWQKLLDKAAGAM